MEERGLVTPIPYRSATVDRHHMTRKLYLQLVQLGALSAVEQPFGYIMIRYICRLKKKDTKKLTTLDYLQPA